MAAEANTDVAGGAGAQDQLSTTASSSSEAVSAESASKSPQESLQTTESRPQSDPLADEHKSEDARNDEEAPQSAGERLASHLDMLAETVRAIVTRVMQPQNAEPCGDEEATATPEEEESTSIENAEEATSIATRSEYPLAVRQECVTMHNAGKSYKQIAAALGMPVTTVQTIVKRAKQQGGVVAPAQRAGRPRATDASVEKTIREIVELHPQWSAREVMDAVMESHGGVNVSFETIRRRVRDCRKELKELVERSEVAPSVHEEEKAAELESRDQAASTSEEQGENGDVNSADVVSSDTEVATSGASTAPDETGTVSSAAAASGSTSGKTRRKRGSEYTPEFRELCVKKHEEEGQSYQAIATKFNIPPDSVRAIVRKAKRTGTVVTAPRSGRPRKTTELIDRVILQSVKNSQRSTAKQIQDDLWNIYQVKVSCETIRRRVRDHTKQRLQLVDAPPSASAQQLPPSASNTQPLSSTRHPSWPAPPSYGHQLTAVPSDATRGSLKRKRSEYSIEVREQCVSLHAEGMGYRKIGEKLGMPHTTVRAIVEKVQRTGTTAPAPRSGRPRKTDDILDKVILQTVKANEKCSARVIQQELETAFGVTVSCETVRRRVKDYMRQKHLHAESSSSTSVDTSHEARMRVERPTYEGSQEYTASVSRLPAETTLAQPTQVQTIFSMANTDGMIDDPHGEARAQQSLMDMVTAATATASTVTSSPQHTQEPSPHHHATHSSIGLQAFMQSTHGAAFSFTPHTMQQLGMAHFGAHPQHSMQPPSPSPSPMSEFVL